MLKFSILKNVWLSALVLTLAGVLPALAADAPEKERPASAPAGEKLTDESLLQMLHGLGYEPYETGKFTNGNKFYWVKLKGQRYTFNARFELSTDKTVVWVKLCLGTLPTGEEILPGPLQKLLQASCKGRFWMNNINLYYEQPLDNRAVTAKELRSTIEGALATAENTDQLWKICNWTQAGKQAADLHKTLMTGRKRIIDAMGELLQLISTLNEGKEIDQKKLDQIEEAVSAAINRFKHEMDQMKIPDSQVARDLVAEYKEWLQFFEKFRTTDCAEAIRIVKDTSVKSADRYTNFHAEVKKWLDEEEKIADAIDAAIEKFVKHYRL